MKVIRRASGVLLLLSTLVFVAVPFATSVWYLTRDQGLRSAGPSDLSFTLHRSLSARLPDYIDRRIASGKATTLGPSQITATEWPVYGAFFYLLATENLQNAWEKDNTLASHPPREFGAQAIEASVRIMLDEGHAHWVKGYWGDDYLDDPNCFYRMLMIGSLTAHHNLTGSTINLPLLRRIANDLADDIDASNYGLIDDYPRQCFPADVAVAIAMIRHADTALGTDRREWSENALTRLLDNFDHGLPPYTAREVCGKVLTPSRGCTNGFFFSFVHDIDSTAADRLYADYVDQFWQETRLSRGWREFSKSQAGIRDGSFYMDPDSGPVIGNFGTSATGLGLGAARKHGDHRRAGQLGAELIATALPLPGGRLLIPSLVGDKEHAPHFPEIVIMHQLSISDGSSEVAAPLPPVVWVVLGIELILSVLFFRFSWRLLRSGPLLTRKPTQPAAT